MIVGGASAVRPGELTRFSPHRHAAVFWLGLGAAAILAETLALRPVLWDRDAPIVGLDVVFSLVGGSFCAFGLVAWRRRPDSRTGMLMTATGFAFFVSPLLGQVDGVLASTITVLLLDVWVFFFVPLLLTLLTGGRLQRRLDRWLVASYALPLVLLQVVWMLFAELDGTNLLAVFPDAGTAHAIDRVQRGLLAGACGVTVAVIVVRWWRTTVAVIVVRWWRTSLPRRRALLPSLAGAFTLAGFTVLLVNDLLAGTRSEPLLWFTACSLVLVPAAFLAGQLRSKLARGGFAEIFVGSALQLRLLRNRVGKYANATRATVRVWRTPHHAHIEITDDGVGGADDTRGSGLRGLADRVEALDGRLRVTSPSGGGTTVSAELPCAS